MARLIFLGPPGAGKGTQAVALAQKLHIPHISTGDILRQALKMRSPLGVKAQGYMDRGELVPDNLVQAMVEERLHQDDIDSGWILDGFPRTVSQAEFLDELLQKLGHNSVQVINLDVPDDILIERLLGRGRPDDTEDVIRRRLEVYHADTKPLIGFYSDRHQLVYVNGNQPLEAVNTDLHEVVAP
ncbi:MAG: adenylate kinase [Chroococcus sp. CMT-3BRIN-NPC107]|nr:adenylate kinase [Chroococcus sp. CMT-3BRIN-NPC107]